MKRINGQEFIDKEAPRIKFETCEILKELPHTTQKTSFYPDLIKNNVVKFAETTFLNKFMGNPIEVLEPLNAALYYYLGLDENKDINEEVTEIIPSWDVGYHEVNWIERKVKPSKDWIEELKIKTVKDLEQEFFPVDSKFRERPPEVPNDVHWKNHNEILFRVICEIKMFFVNKTFTELITEVRQRLITVDDVADPMEQYYYKNDEYEVYGRIRKQKKISDFIREDYDIDPSAGREASVLPPQPTTANNDSSDSDS